MTTVKAPPHIYDALAQAAVKHVVPVTLLQAIAFVESGFNPAAEGSQTKQGWTAKGLMQLGPDVIRQFGVTDPFDPRQSADAAAALIAERGKAYDWSVDRILASYNWGAGNLATYERERKTAPQEVRDYVRKVKAARHYYEDEGEPNGVALFTQLQNAVNALRSLNPTWAPALMLEDNMKRTAENYTEEGLVKRWKEYALVHERAPITGVLTPAPHKMEPDPAMHALRLFRSITDKVRSMMAPQAEQQTALDFGVPNDAKKQQQGLGPGLLFLAVMALFMLNRRR